MVGHKKAQQMVLNTENVEQKIDKRMNVSFAEVMTLGDDQISSNELWNWVKIDCQKCPPGSCDILSTQAATVQTGSDQEKLHLLKDHHDSPLQDIKAEQYSTPSEIP
jgi:hypothetical protein